MTWRTIERLKDDSGRCAAELQSNEPEQHSRAGLAPKGSTWRMNRHAALRRSDGMVVLDHALHGRRIWCRSPKVAHFITDALECAHAKSRIERRVAQWGVQSRLLAPLEAVSEDQGAKRDATQRRWGRAEARLYEALERAWEQGLEGVNTWEGVRSTWHADGFRGPNDDVESGQEAIALPEYGAHPWSNGRAIPPSSRRFRRERLQLEQISRWIGMFARVHAYERRDARGHPVDCIERGSPEAGGLGALRLWIASRAVEGLDSALYRYDAARHTLHHTGAASAAFLDAARQSLQMMTRVMTPAGTAIISAKMSVITMQFSHVGLALALQSAGAWLAAATSAGAREGIGVCGQSVVPAKAWRGATQIQPEEEIAIAAFVFGPADIEAR